MFTDNNGLSIRDQYHLAAENGHKLEILKATCNDQYQLSITSKGYCSMIHFLNAKNSINPYKKLNEFNKGRKLLDSLILLDPNNVELRYMRHSVQERIPSFLGYDEELKSDEEFMTTNLNSISDSSSYELIYNYLKAQ